MKLKYAEFYITNVCNLNCTHCNRLNNFAFSGHQLWKDYVDVYSDWSKRIDLDFMSIIGGEPFINPELLDWVEGLLALWPNAKLAIVTNGTLLDRHPDIYKLLVKYSDRFCISISDHGGDTESVIDQKLSNFLKGTVTKTVNDKFRNWLADSTWRDRWRAIKGTDWPDCPNARLFHTMPDRVKQEYYNNFLDDEVLLTDSNGAQVLRTRAREFLTSAVNLVGNKPTLQNSDPAQAIKVCYSKYCHHFSYGKLYKCGIAGILPDFIDQFEMELSTSDKDLIKSYAPAEVDWNDDELSKFLLKLQQGQVIPQCKFCPQEFKKFSLDPKFEKTKIKRIKVMPL